MIFNRKYGIIGFVSVKGSIYELSMRTEIDDADVSFVIELVRNENGFGIYNSDPKVLDN